MAVAASTKFPWTSKTSTLNTSSVAWIPTAQLKCLGFYGFVSMQKWGGFFRMFHIHQDCIQNKNFKSPPKFYSLSLYIWIQISHLQVSRINIIPKYSPITSHVPHFPPCQASRQSKPRSKIPQEVLETTRPERQRGCWYHDIKQHQVGTWFFGTSFYRTWRPEGTDQIHGFTFFVLKP